MAVCPSLFQPNIYPLFAGPQRVLNDLSRTKVSSVVWSDREKAWQSENHSILKSFKSSTLKILNLLKIALFWKKMLFIFERDLETKFDMLVKWSVAETSRSDLAKQTEDI